VADEALRRMRDDGIAPAPNNFEVWYVYYASLNPGLKSEVNDLISAKGKLSESDCRALHEKYLSDRRHQEMFQKAGDQINATLQDVSGLVSNVKTAASEYTGTLENVNRKLSSAKTTEDARQVLESITVDTAKMVEHNKKLEAQLDRSSRAMDELKRDLDRVRREAMTDGLTGLSNRKSFDQQIAQMMKDADKSGKAFTLLMVDIDHFKGFNDSFGHQVGDQVLRLVARTLIEGVKGRDVAARYGGEEFAILLPETNIEAGIAVGNNLRRALEAKEIINRASGEQLGRITMSVGVAQHCKGEPADELIQRADSALYNAKRGGRNQVAVSSTPNRHE